MKTRDEEHIQQELTHAGLALGDASRGTIIWFHLATAVVLALCAIADAVRQIAADLPNHE